jgi:hypothetical protein
MLPPSPEHGDDTGALFDEVERVKLLKVTALIALDDLYWRSSNRPAAAMMTIQVMEVLARPSRAVRVWASRTGLAYKRATLGTGSLASSQAGLGLQYVRAVPLYHSVPWHTRPA